MPVQAGRPPRPVIRERTRRFFELVTRGERFDEAARLAGLSPARALTILSELGPQGVHALISDADADAA